MKIREHVFLGYFQHDGLLSGLSGSSGIYTDHSDLRQDYPSSLIPAYWGTDKLVIRKEGGDGYIDQIRLGGKKYSKYRLTHKDLIHAGEITFVCK